MITQRSAVEKNIIFGRAEGWRGGWTPWQYWGYECPKCGLISWVHYHAAFPKECSHCDLEGGVEEWERWKKLCRRGKRKKLKELSQETPAPQPLRRSTDYSRGLSVPYTTLVAEYAELLQRQGPPITLERRPFRTSDTTSETSSGLASSATSSTATSGATRRDYETLLLRESERMRSQSLRPRPEGMYRWPWDSTISSLFGSVKS